MGICPAETVPVFEYHAAGWVTRAEGFWADVDTGRLIKTGLQTRREERDYWKSQYDALEQKSLDFASEQQRAAEDLQNAVDAERAAWKKEVSAVKRPGLGFFCGLGYTSGGDVQGVVGIGFVKKFW